MRRFFKEAGISQSGTDFAVALDGRTIRTPAGSLLAFSSEPLAAAIAGEWQAQGDEIDPYTMPLTNLAALALDYVGPTRDGVVAEMVKYATTDLLCYRVSAPADLAERQAEAWQPLLDWAASRFEAPLAITTDLAVVQSPASLAALGAAVSNLNDLQLAALRSCAGICNSLILGLAMIEGRIDAGVAWEFSQLDETFQTERWGEDAEAQARQAGMRESLVAVERFLSLVAAPEA